MGQFENLPNELANDSATNLGSSESGAGESAQSLAALQRIAQNLNQLQQDFAGQLTADVSRLKDEKSRLLNDIGTLKVEYEALQDAHHDLKAAQEVALSEQQVAQQQLWAKRLAQALAGHLQQRLNDQLAAQLMTQQAIAAGRPDPNPAQNSTQNLSGQLNGHTVENMQRLVASLDSTIGGTLQSLQQDLHSYQSALTQQIGRMQTTEQQGEVILEALVNRLNMQLKEHITQIQTQLPDHLYTPEGALKSQASASAASPSRPGQAATADAPAKMAPKPERMSAMRRGLVLIVLSTLALSFHNVMVSIIGFGAPQFLGFLSIDSLLPLTIPNSLLLLFLRMVVVLPLMGIVAQKLYPNVWRDLNHFLQAGQRLPILQVLSSGFFLFTSQVLIYKAIPDVGAGVAVTLLFMYPLFTVPLAWFVFGDRPSPLRIGVMFAITFGICFVAWPRIAISLSSTDLSPWGIVAALLSSIAFALYLISMQISFKKLHPVPVTLLQFTTILALTGLSVLVLSSFQRMGSPLFGLEIQGPQNFSGFGFAVLLLGVLTLIGYLFNNYGVRFMGAAQASIVASSGPVVTAIMAYVMTPGPQSALHIAQWFGVIIVTLGVVALSFERIANKPKSATKLKRLNT
ncbi:MAG: EamA family transporter [Cyanobacteria bacterium P01_D01_bin.128]